MIFTIFNFLVIVLIYFNSIHHFSIKYHSNFKLDLFFIYHKLYYNFHFYFKQLNFLQFDFQYFRPIFQILMFLGFNLNY